MQHLTSLKVAALTQGHSAPSARFRVAQHVNELFAHGVEVHDLFARFSAYPPISKLKRFAWLPAAVIDASIRSLRANSYDICLLQRELVSTLLTAEPLIRRPILFDVDDAIFLHPRGNLSDAIARRSALRICGNNFLAEHYSRFGPVEIVPTAVDTTRFVPGTWSKGLIKVIGWSGSSSGFKYLYAIEPALRKVLVHSKNTILKIVADRPPNFSTLPADRVIFEKWTAETEVLALQSFTIGLMPLNDTLWERGKCSFKMLTYMACGLPVVVSPVGMNAEVLAHGQCGLGAKRIDEWTDALTFLLSDTNTCRNMGMVGRQVIDRNYAKHIICPRLAKIIKAYS